jgi:hypothetical protein
MSAVVRTVSFQSTAERIRNELGADRHVVVPSMGGYDVRELTEEERLEAERQHYIARAEQLERGAGVLAILAKRAPRSREMLEKQAKSEIAQAMRLRERAAQVGK